MTTAAEWIDRYAKRLGLETPDETSVGELLSMTAVAAHASERTAAPISSWLVGQAGISPDEALAHARALAAEIDSEAVAGEVAGHGDSDPTTA
jgi:hypothetical protein